MHHFRRLLVATAVTVAALLLTATPPAEALPRSDSSTVLITWSLRNGTGYGSGTNSMNYSLAHGTPLDYYDVGLCSASGTTCWTAE